MHKTSCSVCLHLVGYFLVSFYRPQCYFLNNRNFSFVLQDFDFENSQKTSLGIHFLGYDMLLPYHFCFLAFQHIAHSIPLLFQNHRFYRQSLLHYIRLRCIGYLPRKPVQIYLAQSHSLHCCRHQLLGLALVFLWFVQYYLKIS